jgi:hypothetical protein
VKVVVIRVCWAEHLVRGRKGGVYYHYRLSVCSLSSESVMAELEVIRGCQGGTCCH